MGYFYFGEEEYLEHHGIRGQKWGVRRYETSSGHLTPAGRARYNKEDGEYVKISKGSSSGSGKKHSSALGSKIAAKVYGANEKFYTATKNKTMANANRKAKEAALKRVEQAKNSKPVKPEKPAKDHFSAASTGHKLAAKLYGVNEKFYRATNNKTMANMNKAAKEGALKRAAEAQKEANKPKSFKTPEVKLNASTVKAGLKIRKQAKNIDKAIQSKDKNKIKNVSKETGRQAVNALKQSKFYKDKVNSIKNNDTVKQGKAIAEKMLMDYEP